MNYYDKLRQIKRLVSQIKKSSSIEEKNLLIKKLEESKKEVMSFVYYVNEMFGNDYAIYIFHIIIFKTIMKQ